MLGGPLILDRSYTFYVLYITAVPYIFCYFRCESILVVTHDGSRVCPQLEFHDRDHLTFSILVGTQSILLNPHNRSFTLPSCFIPIRFFLFTSPWQEHSIQTKPRTSSRCVTLA